MLKCLIGAAALAILTLPAAAQTRTPETGAPGGTPQTTGPSSGAGIPGHPGGKSGPAAKPQSETSGATSDQTGQQDSSKIPGAPGGKSGPPARRPGAMEK
jgi:hypothetical protein